LRISFGLLHSVSTPCMWDWAIQNNCQN
jgi:hypothetical protein